MYLVQNQEIKQTIPTANAGTTRRRHPRPLEVEELPSVLISLLYVYIKGVGWLKRVWGLYNRVFYCLLGAIIIVSPCWRVWEKFAILLQK